MLFQVQMDVRLPPDLDPAELDRINAAEHERAAEIQEAGKWPHLWRVAGRFANVSIFDVDGPDELHELVSSLPLYPYMDVQVTALARHPGSIH
jgi:muconolactone D-isomerase